jgi:hypothetical protein
VREAEKLTSRNVYGRWEEVEIKGMIKTVIRQDPGMIRWSMDEGHYRKVFKKDNGAEGNKNRGRIDRGKERPDIVTKNRKIGGKTSEQI